jgi:hypothetical protein
MKIPSYHYQEQNTKEGSQFTKVDILSSLMNGMCSQHIHQLAMRGEELAPHLIHSFVKWIPIIESDRELVVGEELSLASSIPLKRPVVGSMEACVVGTFS